MTDHSCDHTLLDTMSAVCCCGMSVCAQMVVAESHECARHQDPWPPANVTALAQRSARWLVTRGEHGADEVTAAGTVSLPAEKVGSPRSA